MMKTLTYLLNDLKNRTVRFKRLYVLFFSFFFVLSSFSAFAQRGKDGTETITTAGVIFNRYDVLSVTANAGATTITVTNIANLSGTAIAGAANNPYATNALGACDLLLIIKMQGANMTTTDVAAYGTITAYNNVGVFEYVEVGSIAGNVITLAPGSTLQNTYTVVGNQRVQVIRIPRLNGLTINAASSLTGRAWGTVANTGGIVAVEVNGNSVINGSIDVSGIGFRGGAFTNNAGIMGVVSYRSTATDDGAPKGESIVGNWTDYDGLNGRYGRGAPANGGGGGNAHNAGGGGGSNGDNGVAYTGTGNPILTVANWANAWNLEVAGFATSTSSGGGRGGYTYGANDINALTMAPGNAGWGGDSRRNVGGFGGKPLNYSLNTRLFLGGGGGAGDGNNTYGGSGSSGGGIVALIVYGTVSGTGSINANGNNGMNTSGGNNDAPGGAGGGGAVRLLSSGTITGITINANGGIGGNQLTIGNESEGPGGGGGGGYLQLQIPL